MERNALLKKFDLFQTENGGIESFVYKDSPETVIERLRRLNEEPLSKVQFNQLLGLCEERAMSDGFFQYYWLRESKGPYDLTTLPGYSPKYIKYDKVVSVDHLTYGLNRIFVDGLLYRGNVRAFFRENSSRSLGDLTAMVQMQLVDTAVIKSRGPGLPLKAISKDNRYLISEMACKSYGDTPNTQSELRSALLAAWDAHAATGGEQVQVRVLLAKGLKGTSHSPNQRILEFSADDILDEYVSSRGDIELKYEQIAGKFLSARSAALENTRLYLSLVNDLDVYVATSMRDREDFRNMADKCSRIFEHKKVQDLHLRYFDPTLSAADGHQDKGLIECLMVKCAKVLVYCAGKSESYGKDAEAAMALSLGKPVIFLCDEHQKQEFFREIHPLSRLINFNTGVAVGAMVTTDTEIVSELLDRIFENSMQYALRQRDGKPGYLQLEETLTKSVVRLQTNDTLLSEAFWNYYKSHD